MQKGPRATLIEGGGDKSKRRCQQRRDENGRSAGHRLLKDGRGIVVFRVGLEEALRVIVTAAHTAPVLAITLLPSAVGIAVGTNLAGYHAPIKLKVGIIARVLAEKLDAHLISVRAICVDAVGRVTAHKELAVATGDLDGVLRQIGTVPVGHADLLI